MQSFPSLSGWALAVAFGACVSLAPTMLRAQTLDSGSGVGPSQEVSTPPNANPINQPGAMRRAVSQQQSNAKKPPARPTSPARPDDNTPPK